MAKCRIENRQAKRKNRNDECNGRCALHRADDGDSREHKPEEHTPRIPHKNACGIEVVVKKADRSARERRGDHRDEGDPLLHRHEENGNGGDRRDARRKAIESVN